MGALPDMGICDALYHDARIRIFDPVFRREMGIDAGDRGDACGVGAWIS